MRREDVPPLLHPLELAFKPIPPSRAAVFADILVRKNVTDTQLADAVQKAIERCEHFPSIAQILKFATEGLENAPRKDIPERTLEDMLDREETALRMLARKYTLNDRSDIARDCQKRIDKIHLVRASRGLTTKLRPAVENFDGTPVYVQERDWNDADLLNAATGTQMYPNALSKRAGERMAQVILDRFGEISRPLKPEGGAKPAMWDGCGRDVDPNDPSFAGSFRDE